MLNQDNASTKPVLESTGFDIPLPVTLAVSTQWHDFPKKSDWLLGEGFSLEYTPDAGNLDQTAGQLVKYIAEGARIRHHGYFPGYEIGDNRSDKAEEAMQLHFQALDAIKGIGEQNITVHVGLVADIELNHAHVVRNLRRLVEYGRHHGITVSLENLRFGPTSYPETVLEWTQKTGAKITLDIGHAVSCSRVVQNEMNVPQIVDLFSHDLVEVHFYESETDRHHAPQDMNILGPIVDRLLSTECTWWTIELDAHEEILRTRDLISDHLKFPKHQ
jgi:sugar phosphate isomerase/epimerase